MSLFGPRDFLASAEVSAFIKQSKNFRPGSEILSDARALLFFETRKQHTWLVATKARVYCILDDRRKPEPHINWAVNRSEIFDDSGEFVLGLEVAERDKPSNMSGHLHFGPEHRRWLYSKALFRTEPPEVAVENFLREAMEA